LGKVRQDNIKKIARELIRRYPGKFTNDFEMNKKLVIALTTPSSTKIRNKIAGYVTSLRKAMVTEVGEEARFEMSQKKKDDY